MLKNYIKIALRNLRKNKIDSAISIGGLAVGLACCILLVFYVRFEWSHDNFHENAERLFRVTEQTTGINSGEIRNSLSTPYPLGAALDSTFPEIERMLNITLGAVHIKEQGKFRQTEVTFSDPGFFETFTFPIASGNTTSPLENPDNIVLTEDAAIRYFGTKNAVGETLTFKFHEDEYDLVVSAVAVNPPANSSLKFDLLLPFENYFRQEGNPERRATMRNSWYIGFGETWVLLDDKASAKNLESKFPALLKSQFGNFAERQNMQMGLQPLNGAYFNQEYQSYITGNTNILYSSILGGIAIVILIIAGMNFMSLTLSRASQRSHEIGVRKAAGAQRNQVSLQLFGEIFITCSVATILGLMLAEIATPFFQTITGKTFDVYIMGDPVLWLALLAMVAFVTLITGAYPAFKMATKNTALMFSSRRSTERIPFLVKGLITVQFTLSIAFLIATFTMNNQLSFLLNKDLGFNSSNVVTVEIRDEADAAQQAELFANEARRLSGVQQVAKTGSPYRNDPRLAEARMGFGMGLMTSSTTLPGFEGGIMSEVVDENFIEVMGFELLEGQNFSSDRPTKLENGIIVNEEFVRIMNWNKPIGQIIEDKASWGPPFDGKEVIGVVENFHFRPLFEQLQPIALQHIKGVGHGIPRTILVKVKPGMVSETVNQLSNLWNEILPSATFNYGFLDDLVEMQYMEEQRWSNIIRFSSIIAIALACFGLFGLAALSAQRRTKEIGIRKVLGATVTSIVTLLSKDFVKLVILGFVAAIPIAWYAMNQWLTDFAYRIEIGPGIFALAGGAALVIALLTVSWQSIKAAVANPVDSLRSE